jgi:hypothetical protein
VVDARLGHDGDGDVAVWGGGCVLGRRHQEAEA